MLPRKISIAAAVATLKILSLSLEPREERQKSRPKQLEEAEVSVKKACAWMEWSEGGRQIRRLCAGAAYIIRQIKVLATNHT